MKAKEIVLFWLFMMCSAMASFYGFSVGLIYIVAMLFVYRIYISTRIHSWKESGRIMVATEENQHIFYTHGGPVQESVRSLENISASSEKILEQVFNHIIFVKIVFLGGLISLAIYDGYQCWQGFIHHQFVITPYWLIGVSMGAIISLFVLIKLLQTVSLALFVRQRKWYLHRYHYAEQTDFSAYKPITVGQEISYQPLLLCIL